MPITNQSQKDNTPQIPAIDRKTIDSMIASGQVDFREKKII